MKYYKVGHSYRDLTKREPEGNNLAEVIQTAKELVRQLLRRRRDQTWIKTHAKSHAKM